MSPRTAVGLVFGCNGLTFSCLASRLPDVRSGLGLDNGGLGLLLLAISIGSLVALSAGGRLVTRLGAARVVRMGAMAAFTGLLVSAVGVAALHSVVVATLAFALYGGGIAAWDIAMNVEAAEVERALGRTVMPRFHAGWSLGSFGGAGAGVVLTKLDVGIATHLVVVGALAVGIAASAAGSFLAARPTGESVVGEPGPSSYRSAWREPCTLALGLMVLCFAAAEGAANDWLTLALIDGYDARRWVGVAGFALFVSAMTLGRVAGPVALDRFGRAPVLVLSALVAAGGIVVVVVGGAPLAVLGIVLWGIGVALGFPVGISAAADDPVGAARRVSVVATIGYGAFLVGPPLLGALGDAVGTLRSLMAVAVLMAIASVTAGAAGRRA